MPKKLLLIPAALALCLLLLAGCDNADAAKQTDISTVPEATTVPETAAGLRPYKDMANPYPGKIESGFWDMISRYRAELVFSVEITLRSPTDDEKALMLTTDGKSLLDIRELLDALASNDGADASERETLTAQYNALYYEYYSAKKAELAALYGVTDAHPQSGALTRLEAELTNEQIVSVAAYDGIESIKEYFPNSSVPG